MPIHDQRFKTLIRVFFADFLKLFFAEWVPRFDLDSVQWEEQELIPDPPEGDQHLLDLVARIRLTQPMPGYPADTANECFAVIHFEVESPDQMSGIDRRMPTYHIHLRNKLNLPVLPIVIFLKMVGEGIGVREYGVKFFEMETLTVRYLYVALHGLDAIEYLEGDNLLGVALSALMRIPRERVAWLGAEALRKISEAPVASRQRFLLGECVRAYLPIDEEQGRIFDELLIQEAYKGADTMNKTFYEEGIEEHEQATVRNLCEAVLVLFESRFNEVPEGLADQLAGLPEKELWGILKTLPKVSTPDALPSLKLGLN